MRAVFVAGLAALLSLPIGASADLPERRSVVTNDIDYPGRDLQPLFETTLEACERVCLNDPDCGAFTFNARAGACFSKTGAGEAVPFDGAISGRVINATNADIARADARSRRSGLSDRGGA